MRVDTEGTVGTAAWVVVAGTVETFRLVSPNSPVNPHLTQNLWRR